MAEEKTVTLNVGSGKRFHLEHYRDTDDVRKIAVIDDRSGSKVAVFEKEQVLVLEGSGKDVTIAIPGNMRDEDTGKPIISIHDKAEHAVTIDGPYEAVKEDGKEGAGMDAKDRFQQLFDTLRAKGLDPQVAALVAQMQQRSSGLGIKHDATPQDLNSLQASPARLTNEKFEEKKTPSGPGQ